PTSTSAPPVSALSLHDALPICDARGLLDLYGHQQDALMQHLIVLDELGQRQRHAVWRGRQEHGGARKSRVALVDRGLDQILFGLDRKSTRLNSSHQIISYAVFC